MQKGKIETAVTVLWQKFQRKTFDHAIEKRQFLGYTKMVI